MRFSKKGLRCHCLKSNNVGRDFCPDFQRFSQKFRAFVKIFDKSKLLGVRLHPLHPPCLLNHCSRVTEDGTRRLIHRCVKQTQPCVNFIAL